MSEFRIARSLAVLEQLLVEVKMRANYVRSEIVLADQSDWLYNHDVLSHRSGGFFHITGVKHLVHTDEEYLMFYQPQSALTGLIVCKMSDEPMILLQARVEPGNSYIIQYGPTIQSTAANYLMLHGGKPTSFSDCFLKHMPECQLLTHSIQHDLGKRYFQKSKTHHYVEVPNLLPAPDNMIWVSLNVLKQAYGTSNFLNTDLRSLLAVFDWDTWLGYESSSDLSSNNINFSFPLMREQSASPISNYKMCGLSELKKWEINSNGVRPKFKGLPGVQMFQVESSTREVSKWVQPLLTVSGVGMVRQIVRRTALGLEWLVHFNKEVGISSSLCIAPTYVRYPEELLNDSASYEEGVVIRTMLQSDEGGRFLENETAYEIREVGNDWQHASSNHFWVPTIVVKQWLAASNHCSIQLRNAASLLMDELCPAVFANK